MAALGGDGLGTMWGEEKAEEMLKQADLQPSNATGCRMIFRTAIT